MKKFKQGDKIKNRFRQDSNFNYTTFGTVVGYEGNLLLVKIANRCYKGLNTDYSHCVPEDWILV